MSTCQREHLSSPARRGGPRQALRSFPKLSDVQVRSVAGSARSRTSAACTRPVPESQSYSYTITSITHRHLHAATSHGQTILHEIITFVALAPLTYCSSGFTHCFVSEIVRHSRKQMRLRYGGLREKRSLSNKILGGLCP